MSTKPPPPSMTEDQANALVRWRLLLGKSSEDANRGMGLAHLGSCGGSLGGDSDDDLDELEETLDFVYGQRGSTKLKIPDWLGRVRKFFKNEVVAFVQKDAMEKRGLTQLLLEPETLGQLERNVDLVATLVSMREMIPQEAKDTAREIIREIVEALRKQLETHTKTAIMGALRRNAHSPLKVARNIDYKRTIQRNLRTWDRDKKRLLPESISFFANQRKQRDWEIVLMVDQSGSMAVSAVYSSIMASIFASLDVLATRLLLFNHEEVVDLSDLLDDPVEVLFTAQLGGAENYNLPLAYAEQHYIRQPEKTIAILLTDLFHTAGDNDEFLQRMQRLVESKVKTIVLLKLSDGGRASYNHELAKQCAALGVHCFGATPALLVDIMAKIMSNQSIDSLVQLAEKR